MFIKKIIFPGVIGVTGHPVYLCKYYFPESFNEWSYVADATLMKSCSMKGITN